MKKALVISGGGSKGAFAGGVVEYLIANKGKDYDLFIGTSTGSLMVSHLALGMIKDLKKLYTSVNQKAIFSNNPFTIKKIGNIKITSIKKLNILWNILKGKKTFGESKNLRKLIKNNVTKELYNTIRERQKEVIVTVSNLTANRMEYKSIKECSYEDFCDWIWASCNYVPFMSLLEKNGQEYADGCFGALVPIREAIKRGATEIDAVILDTEKVQINKIPSKNPFSLMLNVFDFTIGNVERHNVTIGELAAKKNEVTLNLYYTPTVLTTNSLIFDKKLMKKWWKYGYQYAKNRKK